MSNNNLSLKKKERKKLYAECLILNYRTYGENYFHFEFGVKLADTAVVHLLYISKPVST